MGPRVATALLVGFVSLLSGSCLMRTPSRKRDPRVTDQGRGLLPLRIDGVWYDVGDYANKHKGGRWLLEYARGRDVTPIFHAIHMHGETKAKAALARLPTLESSHIQLPTRAGLSRSQLEREQALQGPYVVALDENVARAVPKIDSPLRSDLQLMIRRRFPTIGSMKATPKHWFRTAVAAVFCATCWTGWLQGNPLAILILPFAHWLLAAHTVHEATHGALSSNPTVNFLAQFTAHPILFNVYVWIPQHILSHHQYTNDPQHDVDVHHFAGARLAREQAPYSRSLNFNEGWTFVWKGCLATLGTCILQPLRTLLEKPTPNFDVNLTPIPAVVSKRSLALSMLPSFFVLFYPILAGIAGVMSPLQSLFAEIWPWVGMSMIWTSMTQPSHVQESTQWSATDDECWTAQQIGTSLDYSVGNPVLTWVTAGLNNQGLHHAMPTISSAHFADLYSEYESICQKHGMTLRQSQDLGSACRECLEYVFALNKPPGISV
jgi:fatty acid desaturase